MKVTARITTKDGKMVRIFLDGSYSFSIPVGAYTVNHLYDKEEISEEELGHIKRNVLVQEARERAVRLLTARDRSEAELEERLKKIGFDGDISHKVVEDLKAIGYVNDVRYIQKYASDRAKNKAISRKALKYELTQKGLDSDLIDEALADFEQNEDEVAYRAAKKKFGKYDLTDPKIERRALSFLAHRGFSYETAKSVLMRLKGKEE
jgi:regulatory protein